MIKPEVLDALVAAGCTAEQIAAAVKADIGTRSTNAERQARFRERRRALQRNESNVTSVTVTEPPSPKKEIPPTPPKEKTTPSHVSDSERGRASDFDLFWESYPNKVGKRDAAKAFVGARKRADIEAILAGVRRYAAKTDDRPWCNPATFLNQDRWADDPAAPIAAQPRSGAPPPRNGRMTPTEAALWLTERENERQAQSDNTTARIISPDFGGRSDIAGLVRGTIHPVFGRGD